MEAKTLSVLFPYLQHQHNTRHVIDEPYIYELNELINPYFKVITPKPKDKQSGTRVELCCLRGIIYRRLPATKPTLDIKLDHLAM